MPTLTDIVSLIPIFVSAFLGAFSYDYFKIQNVNTFKETLINRIIGIFIGSTVATSTMAVAIIEILKDSDWKFQSFISLLLGFLGYRIAMLLAKTNFGVDILLATKSFFDNFLEKLKKIDEIDKRQKELDKKDKHEE